MRTMQEKVLRLIEVTVEPEDWSPLEVVQRASASNVGTLYVQPFATLETPITIGYDFQAEAVSLTLKHRGVPIATRLPSGRPSVWRIEYTDAVFMTEFLSKLRAAVAAETKARLHQRPDRARNSGPGRSCPS